MKSFLEKRFQHPKWFKEGVTVKEALDYFTSCGDFYIEEKIVYKELFGESMTKYIITDGHGSYTLSSEEKAYAELGFKAYKQKIKERIELEQKRKVTNDNK